MNRKIDYVLTGIDQDGNVIMEHSMSVDEVVLILAAALGKEQPEDAQEDEEENQPVQVKQRKCSICGKAGHSKKTCPKVEAAGGAPSSSQIKGAFSVRGRRGTAFSEDQRDEIIRMRQRLNEIFSKQTGQSLEKIANDTRRNLWLSAQEAIEYGLAGKVIETTDELV